MRGKIERSAVSPVVKYCLFFENFVIWVVGLTFTVLGAYILAQKNKIVKDAFDFFLDPSILMCTAGSLIVFVSFFGCMGALRENTCFLKFFNYALTFMFVGEICLVIFVFIFYFVPDAKQKLGLFPQAAMEDAIVKYGIVDDEDMVNLIDNIQRSLHCCGLGDTDNGYLDWNKNMYFNCTEGSKSPEKCSVPASCCRIEPGEMRNILCGRGVMSPKADDTVGPGVNIAKIYQEGCIKALGNWINSNALVAGGILLGFLIPQMFIMCVSRTLRYQIKEQKAKWSRPQNRPNKFQGDGPYYITPRENSPLRNGRSSGIPNPAFEEEHYYSGLK